MVCYHISPCGCVIINSPPTSLNPNPPTMPLLLLARLLLLLLSATSIVSGKGNLGQDLAGNIFINSTAGNHVLVNGVSVTEEIATLSSIVKEQASVIQSLRADLLTLAAGGKTPAGAASFPRLYAIGGDVNSNIEVRTGAVERLEDDVWNCVPGLLSDNYDARRLLRQTAAVVSNSSIYALSVANSNSFMERFNGSTWFPAPSWNVSRQDFSAATFNGSIFILGGVSPQDWQRSLDSVERFDGIKWSPAPSMRLSRCGLAAADFKNRLYVAGGQNITSRERYAAVEAFDGTTWSFAPSMTRTRCYFGMAVFQGYLFAIGGDDARETSVERFDGVSWQYVGQISQKPSGGFALAVNGGFLYMLGGDRGDSNVFSEVNRFNGKDWMNLTPLSVGRYNLGAVFF